MIDGLLKENIIKMKQIVYLLSFLFSLTLFSQVNEIDQIVILKKKMCTLDKVE